MQLWNDNRGKILTPDNKHNCITRFLQLRADPVLLYNKKKLILLLRTIFTQKLSPLEENELKS